MPICVRLLGSVDMADNAELENQIKEASAILAKSINEIVQAAIEIRCEQWVRVIAESIINKRKSHNEKV
jgi:hypothetical protein